jgi:hypothetical protein
MRLKFFKRINTSKNSIFYSLIDNGKEIVGFGRQRYDCRIIKKIILDTKFNIINEKDNYLKGEDPRTFYIGNDLYVLDNYLNDMYLIKESSPTQDFLSFSKEYIPIPIDGKNLTFINYPPSSSNLYFIHYFKPFCLYNFDLVTRNITKIKTIEGESDNEYRGGTPAYSINPTTYYGFGHRTYFKNGILTHDIFKWVLTFDSIGYGECITPTIELYDIYKPENSKNITDPTSVIEINNKKYLITAESDEAWFKEQDYVTNVYEIIEN